MRAPFIVFQPTKIKSAISDYPGHFIDILPSLIELTGTSYPKEFKGNNIPVLAGESFVPVLVGDKEDREHPIFWQYRNGKAVRTNDYRLVWESNTEISNLVDYSEGPDKNFMICV